MPANKIFMLQPVHFGFNEETAQSNSFQNAITDSGVMDKALLEFENAVAEIRKAEIVVDVLKGNTGKNLPDEVFLNNWFSTHEGGKLILYPMQPKSRRGERSEESISQIVSSYPVNEIVDYSSWEQEEFFLEGTGSLVFDYYANLVYASISERTSVESLKRLPFNVISFETFNNVYHTNVVVCCTEHTVPFCLEVVKSKFEREKIKEILGVRLMEISEGQMNSFCGNMIELCSKKGDLCLVLSRTAMEAFTEKQLKRLSRYHRLVVLEIPVIEKVGGGSARCMIAENYL